MRKKVTSKPKTPLHHQQLPGYKVMFIRYKFFDLFSLVFKLKVMKNLTSINKFLMRIVSNIGWVNLRNEDFQGLQMTQTTHGIER